VVGETPFVLVVNPKRLPVANAKDMVAALKAKPGYYNFASSGNGTILHLAAEMFLDASGTQARHIPYKGVGNMITDLISGQVDFGVLAVPAVQGHIKSGALRAIGITGTQRVATLPDLPTLQEQGYKVDVGGWFAVIGPKGLPADQVKRLHDAVVTAWSQPDVKAAMDKQDNLIHPSTPEQAVAFFRSEEARYAHIVQKADVRID
jgi:tripartite-type tricarboxylate transporter receptor subunit TctC